MPGKNDLSAYKLKPKNKLQLIQTQQSADSQPSPAGRKLKPAHEKQSEIAGLRFTKSEYAIIKRKAGLVPIATFLKQKLIKNGLLK